MSELRDAYKKWSDPLDAILAEPTEQDLAGCIPAFHQLTNPNGTPMTVGQYHDFAVRAYKAKQKREIIGLLMVQQRMIDALKDLHDKNNVAYIDIIERLEV